MTTGGAAESARDTLSDRQAWDALRSGRSEAIAAVVRAWSPGMLRLARTQLPDPAAAEDVVQDAWLTVLTGLDRFEGRSALRTWVLGIVVNHARRARARRDRVVPFSGEWWQDRVELRQPAVRPDRFDAAGGWRVPPFVWEALPESVHGVHELQEIVEQAVGTLPVRQRAVLVARDGLGLVGGDVAALFGVSETNQRVLLHRARSRVRAVVEDYAAVRQGAPPPNSSPEAPDVRRGTARRLSRAGRGGRADAALACRQLVELVHDYLDGDLDAALRARVERHLDQCHVCPGYVAQVRRLIDLTASLASTAPSASIRRLVTSLGVEGGERADLLVDGRPRASGPEPRSRPRRR